MQNHQNEDSFKVQVIEYEAMSQKGAVGFIEEAVFITLIEYYLKEHQSCKASQVVEHAIAQYPYSADFYIWKAQIFIYSELFEEALESLETATSFSPASVQIALLKVKALMELDYIAEAFEIIDTTKQIALGESLSQIYFCEAQIFETLGEYQRMYESLHYALTIFPGHEDALEQMVWAVEMIGNYEESIELHTAILDQHPYCDRAWFNLGFAYSGLENYEMAIEAYEYAFITNHENENAYRECAYSYIKVKKFDKALDCYDEARDKITPDSDFLVNIGYCYESLNDMDRALTHYHKALSLRPQNDQAYFRIGKCHASREEWGEAVCFYKKAVQLNCRREEYLAGLGEAFYKTNKIKKARQVFKKAADTAPETSKYWLRYTAFLLSIGEAATAIEILDEAEIYAQGVELLYFRVICLFALEKRQKALYMLGEALMTDYDQHTCLFDWMPALKNDTAALKLLEKYKP